MQLFKLSIIFNSNICFEFWIEFAIFKKDFDILFGLKRRFIGNILYLWHLIQWVLDVLGAHLADYQYVYNAEQTQLN